MDRPPVAVLGDGRFEKCVPGRELESEALERFKIERNAQSGRKHLVTQRGVFGASQDWESDRCGGVHIAVSDVEVGELDVFDHAVLTAAIARIFVEVKPMVDAGAFSRNMYEIHARGPLIFP